MFFFNDFKNIENDLESCIKYGNSKHFPNRFLENKQNYIVKTLNKYTTKKPKPPFCCAPFYLYRHQQFAPSVIGNLSPRSVFIHLLVKQTWCQFGRWFFVSPSEFYFPSLSDVWKPVTNVFSPFFFWLFCFSKLLNRWNGKRPLFGGTKVALDRFLSSFFQSFDVSMLLFCWKNSFHGRVAFV